jgi:NAD-dependent dihydropyrimidine dehydrogenase PreA subunit/flavodoxin
MSAEIYYFSGTGNSLFVARELAAKTSARLIAIPSVISMDTINPNADLVGIVFPVYHGGLPQIINRFAEKLVAIENRYIFGVCTYGDSPGLASEYLAKLIEPYGGELAAGFGVHMPYNYITPSFNLKDFFGSFTLREIDPEKQQILFSEAHSKLDRIATFVNGRQTGILEVDGEFISRLVDAVHLHDTLGKTLWLKIAGITEPTGMPFRESIQLMDRAFRVDENCKGCGKCVKVCPVGNVELMDKKPVWHQHCEQCFACLQWCPQEAIQFGVNTPGKKRYHHPDVKFEDIALTIV